MAVAVLSFRFEPRGHFIVPIPRSDRRLQVPQVIPYPAVRNAVARKVLGVLFGRTLRCVV
jgi:hypothetical protein